MWATPAAISSLLTDLPSTLSNPNKSRLMKLLELIDIISITLYQPIENVAFAADHDWILRFPSVFQYLRTKLIGKLHLTSVVSAVSCGSGAIANTVSSTIDPNTEKPTTSSSESLYESKEKNASLSLKTYVWSSRLWAIYVVIEVIKVVHDFYKLRQRSGQSITRGGGDPSWNSEFFRRAVAHLASLPLTYHWSLYEGCFGDLSVGLFGTLCTLFDSFHDWSEVAEEIRRLKV
ncbi:unnamed protein product [Ambrosiozyma monospora]|uniref:Unnamed protein product n=1 Tax=Ambrosiozyma monospora TaxID=43982 RepID=A0A9W6YVS9_AMBMO|nr:unnamed protein product [Ambrosiozyma monospora]